MTSEEFKSLLLAAAKIHFPQATLALQEKRSIIIEARIHIKEGLFVHIYFNALTGRKSYTLIHRSQRVLGYDNRRFWHRHPFGNPELHIRCKEPALEAAFKEMREALQKL